MAHVRIEPRTGNYELRFRWGGRNISRTLKTKSEREAKDTCARVEETISLIQRGRIVVPDGADVIEFIVSDGQRTKPLKETHKLPASFGELIKKYLAAIEGAKAKNTIYGEKIHLNHLKGILGERTAVTLIDNDKIQGYVFKRAKQKWNGTPIRAATIRKELRTLQTIWRWAEDNKYVKSPLSLRGVLIPRSEQKPPFRTWGEIEKIVATITDVREIDELWSCLFLSMDEVKELLAFVHDHAEHAFIEPMFAMAAYTGARRSEIVRSLIEDWDFTRGVVSIREKKRVKDKTLSFRHVPIHPNLKAIIEAWLKVHPGGRQMIVEPAAIERRKTAPQPVPLTVDAATHHFNQTISGSDKWKVLRGFHTLRHSFASNLASRGVSQPIINSWMGHQSEEMVDRYRHLFPSDHSRSMDLLTNDMGTLLGK